MGCVVAIIIILIIGAISLLVQEGLFGSFIFWAIILFIALKFLFHWLPIIIANFRISYKENEISKIPDEMESEIKSLNREFQHKSEIILKNPDLTKSRIENLAAQNTNNKYNAPQNSDSCIR